MNGVSVSDLRNRFEAAGQGHVFHWWDEIGANGRSRLLSQLAVIDLEELGRLAQGVRAGTLAPRDVGAPELPEYVALPETAADHARRAKARRAGEDLLRAGKVAALTVAGGQGTRLGYDAPKGTYPIGPVSRKTLFQIHAEKLLAAERRYGRPLPWYIMTSDTTDAATREYFERERWLGLDPRNVRFFRQRMMPALDRDFRLVMISKDGILLSPNGHGGTLLALSESGMLDDMESRGIEEVSYFQVDNLLVPAADPVFLGFHRLAKADMSNKAIWKRDPAEPLGAFVRLGGRLTVIEYSDLTDAEKERRTPDGRLVYGLGSPAIHALRVDFARKETRGGFRLPFHLAEKASPYLDGEGILRQPVGKNVYKFETFIFDALSDAERSLILEIRREEEFSALKNASGKDSVETCRRDLSALGATWLEKAGVAVPRDPSGALRWPIEISPLFALDAEEFVRRIPPGLRVDGPLYLGPPAGNSS